MAGDDEVGNTFTVTKKKVEVAFKGPYVQVVIDGAFAYDVGRVGVIVVDLVELAAILEVGVGRQVHACVVEIDDEVVVVGGDVQPHSAVPFAGGRRVCGAFPQVRIVFESVNAIPVVAL